MRLALPFCIVAAALLTPTAFGQNFRLDLTLTYRRASASEVLTDVVTGGRVVLPPGVYRFELRYRIVDLTADMITSGGLATAAIAMNATGPGVMGSSFSRAVLTNDQLFHPTFFVTNPDTSGFNSSSMGLIEPFRAGLSSDGDVGNGGPTLGFPSFVVVPFTATPRGQNSRDFCNPIFCGPGPNLWGLFAFNLTYSGQGRLTITASSIADPQTGDRYAYFPRQANFTSPTPVMSTLATDASITIAPRCIADYDVNSLVSVLDIFAFLTDWFASSPRADIDASGAITVQDVFDFLTAWFAQCG